MEPEIVKISDRIRTAAALLTGVAIGTILLLILDWLLISLD